ncbi:surface-adhesin E family protein [Neisseria sp.]
MKKMLCLAVFALGLATPAVAEDWVLLGINSNNTTIFGDADSRTDNSAWFETRYAEPKKMISNGKFYNTAKALLEMDCSGKRHRLLTVTAYSESGNPIGSYTPSYAEWSYVIPGTGGESVYKFVCNHDSR